MEKVRAFVKISGIVQGVGFRPFVHKLVEKFSLCGYIKNTSLGVEIEVEGLKTDVGYFVKNIFADTPKASIIEDVEVEYMEDIAGYNGFEIRESILYDVKDTLVSPDMCICENCLAEMFDPKDKRYKYPFINCTDCGPRFTIIKDIPYDRAKTTMSDFDMCDECEREYHDINNRRYHAQPDCCKSCGPEIFYLKKNIPQNKKDYKEVLAETGRKDDAIKQAVCDIQNGKIIAIKGLGGFNLACRADREDVVNELRKRKQRYEKPLAIMVENTSDAKRFCNVNEDEEKTLSSTQRPIVLLEKKNKSSHLYISENYHIGIMLPYTPLHYLIFDAWKELVHDNGDSKEKEKPLALVMTSANIMDMPIIFKNDEATQKLCGIADGILMHNREIETRCDDSLLWVVCGKNYFVRRSRGYAPYPLTIKNRSDIKEKITDQDVFEIQNKAGHIIGQDKSAPSILACGAEQKAGFAITKNDHIFLSQHIGDLKNVQTFENYKQQIKHFENLFNIEPEIIVCDMHPDYLSSEYAASMAETKKLMKVQHHHAHMASCMADNGLEEPCIGIVWDGTGLGYDNTIWGGEFLVGDLCSVERKGSLLPFKLPGGDLAAKEIWRIAISLMYEDMPADLTKLFPDKKTAEIKGMLDASINCPECTSMGRLFDGICALADIKSVSGYEGQGAVLLETEAIKYLENKKDFKDEPFDYEIINDGIYRFDHRKMLKEIISIVYERNDNKNAGQIALRFMNTIIKMSVDMCKMISKETGLSNVVLSGGVFQNQYLLKNLPVALSNMGFKVYHHSRVSTNDEGIAMGQIAVARELIRKRKEI